MNIQAQVVSSERVTGMSQRNGRRFDFCICHAVVRVGERPMVCKVYSSSEVKPGVYELGVEWFVDRRGVLQCRPVVGSAK